MHNLHAIIIPQSKADDFTDLAKPSKVIPLPQDFCMIPVTEAFHLAKAGIESPSVIQNFEFLTDGFSNWLASISHKFPVAYVETDYFGGYGGQGAVLFVEGKCSYGPSFAPDGCINKALRTLGVVVRTDEYDEFHALGLGEHRSTDEWLSNA